MASAGSREGLRRSCCTSKQVLRYVTIARGCWATGQLGFSVWVDIWVQSTPCVLARTTNSSVTYQYIGTGRSQRIYYLPLYALMMLS